ncbi:MAG: Type I restriction-modification system, DNA-methyltransferase subunit M [Ignavibacteriae bacterium]|nr:MAG: Type I restriction-modification system, DNA-methyltransferase subunit M [Ignavibacteriota bacterium]
MLDAETKRRIDTARDILVGKVPDPKSQVEQITIALIYKFMDDMDRESVEMGGKRGFFIGEYEKYSWSNIFNPRLGGHEMLNLYTEAITRMSHNPNLPELFRNIFKNAYLPYRDPETLKLFLKTINEFTYDHSERLGDAFEYLLSVLGSQGDAGQFRTPRHIIDFMVEIVAPKKNELILDPACGTAGFLISAYKYIMRENTSEKYRSSNGNGRGDLLTPEERKKLLTNFKGYDISPDMVRISLVNMYLHGFVNPQIFEYDTLTSEDRWNEYADVILANPPFMTPKGGIKPHKRFSVQSNRSEVLFVDYIAEHLTPTGRAAVIVPEGIIFQSANAYKQLRKMLVENYLYAVVSLPAGVFQPYSGVKTSILLMDKVLSKRTDSILFIKIENDGFDLGAQRRPIDKNDLPDALQVIREYIDKVRNGKADEFNADEKPCSALLVKKEKLAENGEYNLTGDRYRVVEKRKHQKWPMVKLGDLEKQGKIQFLRGQGISKKDIVENGKNKCIHYGEIYTLYQPIIKNVISRTNYEGKIFSKKGDVLIPSTTTADAMGIAVARSLNEDNIIIGGDINIVRTENKFILSDYLALLISSSPLKDNLATYAKGVNIMHISNSDIKNLTLPLPPLEVQQEIVAEIEGYQKIIDGCRQVIDAWKPDIETYLDEELKTYLAEHPEKQEELAEGWPMVKLGEVCEINPKKSEVANLNSDIIVSFLPMEDIGTVQNIIPKKEKKLLEVYKGYTYFKENDVLVAKVTPCFENGKSGIARNLKNGIGFGSSELHVLRPIKEKIVSEYIYPYISSNRFLKEGAKMMTGTGGLQRVPAFFIQEYQIPLPPLEVQQRIVDKIESERKVIDTLREMIKTYEEKIKRVIDRVWGE